MAFTGSLRGGRAMFDAAARRPKPIPVYAEMLPLVFVLPEAARERAEKIAAGYVQLVTLGGPVLHQPWTAFYRARTSSRTLCQSCERGCCSGYRPHPCCMRESMRRTVQVWRGLVNTPSMDVMAEATNPNSVGCQATCTIFTAPADLIAEHPEIPRRCLAPPRLCSSVRALSRCWRLPGRWKAT